MHDWTIHLPAAALSVFILLTAPLIHVYEPTLKTEWDFYPNLAWGIPDLPFQIVESWPLPFLRIHIIRIEDSHHCDTIFICLSCHSKPAHLALEKWTLTRKAIPLGNPHLYRWIALASERECECHGCLSAFFSLCKRCRGRSQVDSKQLSSLGVPEAVANERKQTNPFQQSNINTVSLVSDLSDSYLSGFFLEFMYKEGRAHFFICAIHLMKEGSAARSGSMIIG